MKRWLWSGLVTALCVALSVPSILKAQPFSTFGGMAGGSGGGSDFVGITLTGGTVTASDPVLEATQTWNNAAVAFSGMTLDMTVTSASESSPTNIYTGARFIDFKRSGVSKAAVMSNGKFVATPVGGTGGSIGPSYGWNASFSSGFDFDTSLSAIYVTNAGFATAAFLSANSGGFSAPTTGKYVWSASNNALGVPDTGLCRNGAGVVESNNGTCGSLRDLKLRHYIAAGTAPTISSGFGTNPSIVGADESGRVTVGTGGSAQTGAIAFGTAYGTAPSCHANNETTQLALYATATTTTLTLSSPSAFTAADKLTWSCHGY